MAGVWVIAVLAWTGRWEVLGNGASGVGAMGVEASLPIFVIYLSGCVREDLPREMGLMMTPMMGNRLPPDRLWAADTGCFAQPKKHDNERYLAWLAKCDSSRCLFATAPDVVGDGAATIKVAYPMLERIADAGYRPALVAQDGMEDLKIIPWGLFDCLFVGGSTAWKESESVHDLVRLAKKFGKWVHMGRVNSLRRLRISKALGCDSVDGTYIAYGPDQNAPRMAAWVRQVNAESAA